MNKQIIKKMANKYSAKYSTRNPFELAEYLNIRVFQVPLGNLSGFYKYMKKHKCIFINSDIEDLGLKRFVMAHELGHALLHTKDNCYFMDNKTFMNTSKIEIEANMFACELLISDCTIHENKNLTLKQFSLLLGYDDDFIKLKFN